MQERSSKVIAIVALCVGVVGLSLGFAAFSAQLTVSSSAKVTVTEDSFILTTANAACEDQAGNPVEGISATASGRAIAVSLPQAAFTTVGQSLTCSVDVTSPNFDAKLTSVTGGPLTCDLTSTNGIKACEAIDVIVKHGDAAVGTMDKTAALNYTTPVALARGVAQTIEFKIDYPAENPVGTPTQLPDGTLNVTIPDVVFTYETV